MEVYRIKDIVDFPSVNTIEWYVLPEAIPEQSEPLWIPIAYDKKKFPSIRFGNVQTLHEYRYKELLYQYDRSNDGQKTLFRQVFHEALSQSRAVYRMMLQEDILPSHRFPCSKDIVLHQRFFRRTFKINNRLYFVEEESEEEPKTFHYYLKYHHAPNVDLEKIQQDMNQFIQRFKF